MHIRSLLAGVGLAAVVVAVPLVVVSTASADDAGPPPPAGCPRTEIRGAIGDFLAAHPEVAEERAAIRDLPLEQRRDAWQEYLADNPEIAADAGALRGQLRTQWWELAGDVAAAVDGYPELTGLLDALADAAPGERQALGRAYLAEHPEARAALRDLRQQRRAHREACRAAD